MTSSTLQSRKWQLIGMSQWCRSTLSIAHANGRTVQLADTLSATLCVHLVAVNTTHKPTYNRIIRKLFDVITNKKNFKSFTFSSWQRRRRWIVFLHYRLDFLEASTVECAFAQTHTHRERDVHTDSQRYSQSHTSRRHLIAERTAHHFTYLLQATPTVLPEARKV